MKPNPPNDQKRTAPTPDAREAAVWNGLEAARRRGVISAVDRVSLAWSNPNGRMTRLATAYGFRCVWCRGLMDPLAPGGPRSPQYPTLEHVIPLSLGGPDVWANWRLACRRCNEARGNLMNEVRQVLENGSATADEGEAG